MTHLGKAKGVHLRNVNLVERKDPDQELRQRETVVTIIEQTCVNPYFPRRKRKNRRVLFGENRVQRCRDCISFNIPS
ncbi:hypothetical protein HanIR_Chr14g0721391 [Helianthus annuus]|nr:hypothetical protein HanIR_Chr14g0721391 [Helianthus annuus]